MNSPYSRLWYNRANIDLECDEQRIPETATVWVTEISTVYRDNGLVHEVFPTKKLAIEASIRDLKRANKFTMAMIKKLDAKLKEYL